MGVSMNYQSIHAACFQSWKPILTSTIISKSLKIHLKIVFFLYEDSGPKMLKDSDQEFVKDAKMLVY